MPLQSDLSTPEAPVCWVCGTTRVRHFRDRRLGRRLMPEDVRISDHRYGTTLSLARCEVCGFIFADDPERERMAELYRDFEDPGYEDTQETRMLQMRWLLDSALRSRPGAASVLDVGAGTGLLVSEARRRGLAATGVEPSRSLVATARRNGVDLIEGVLPQPALEERRFDLVFLVDVLEHVSDPVRLLHECARCLAQGGVLIVVTPDVGSLAARLLGPRWWHFRLAHIGYFARRSLDRVTAAAGLEIRRRFRARWVFPVRYLAERLANYLPIHALNRAAERPGVLHQMYERTIALDLRDSYVLHLAHAPQHA